MKGSFTYIIVGLILWELIWKSISLWLAVKNHDKVWFVALLVLNTVGILPIYYIMTHKEVQNGKDIVSQRG
jgi:hypothetical protein